MRTILAILAIAAVTAGAITALEISFGPAPTRACVSIGSMPISGNCP